MMKWGRRKPSSSSSSPSRISSISRVFPMYWLAKFKQNGSNADHKPSEVKKMADRCTPMGSNWKDDRFCGGGGDSGQRSVAMEVDGRGNRQKLKELVPENPPEIFICKEVGSEREREKIEVRRRKDVKDQKWRKANLRGLEEKMAELERHSDEEAEEETAVPDEKDVFELEPEKIIRRTETKRDRQKAKSAKSSYSASWNSNLKTIEEDCRFVAQASEEKLKLKEKKIKELIMSMSEKRRNSSVCVNRELQRKTKQSGKIRVYSPRTAARIECKIKALEDMKRAKMKMKKKEKAKQTTFDSFAVVKRSIDPPEDFRNSMIEMIEENKIGKPEELEELLACYLTLNADEYHDLIIKVFRQVWFDLNSECFESELQNQNERHYCDY
ncbi:hypothetical protein U1Q18_009398 [Sarracenia purpurea var. burkii]